jgi:hypothetical protein
MHWRPRLATGAGFIIAGCAVRFAQAAPDGIYYVLGVAVAVAICGAGLWLALSIRNPD